MPTTQGDQSEQDELDRLEDLRQAALKALAQKQDNAEELALAYIDQEAAYLTKWRS